MSTRDDLAWALESVPGIRAATPYYSGVTNPGTAWIRLDRIEYPNPFGGVAHWNVVVILPQDQKQAEILLEDLLPELLPVVNEHLVVTSVTPQRLQLDGVGVLPCAFINGHREAD